MNYITILFVILTVILVVHTELGPGHKKQAQQRKGFIKRPANLNKQPVLTAIKANRFFEGD